MRALRVVGLTEDGDVVLEDPVRLERFRVPADERLRAAARGDLSRLGQIAIELESQLRPREIQARIRAGASVEQVASAAGVPPQKIERFAYPVLLERSRTAEVAQRAHPLRAEGPDSRMLGDVIAHTFGLRGQEYTEAEWDSWKGEDGKWVVALSWRAGRSDNQAHWTFHPGAHGGTVTAVDEHANDLVEGLPVRPLRTVGPVIDIARQEDQPPPPAAPHEELRAAASDTARHGVGERIDAARNAGGRADPGRDRQPGRSAEQRSPAPPQRPAESRPTETRPTETRPTETRAEAHRAEPAAEASPQVEAPPVPEQQPTSEKPGADAAPSGNRRRKGKPVMPSWDEVLLGVRGQR